jgi:hypothetical protein
MSVLFEQGHSQSAVARLLAVSEGTVRYHRKRMKGAVVDGRSKQVPKAAAFSDGIETWRSQQAGGRINLALQHGLRLGAREERQFRARFQEALGNGRRRWPGWRRAASQRPDPDSQE